MELDKNDTIDERLKKTTFGKVSKKDDVFFNGSCI